MRRSTHMPKTSLVLRTLTALALLIAAGCGGAPDAGQSTGGSASGGVGEGVGLATAPFYALDLPTGNLTTLVNATATAPGYAADTVLFRRIKGQGDDYFIATLELTQQQWTRLAGPASTPWNNLVPAPAWHAAAVAANKPAFNISYDAVTAAIAAYNASHGTKLGLPSDAEWTYACAAGSSATWSWGAATGAPAALANLAVVRESQLGTIGPRGVGGTQANAFGLYDMHGNVWEWTSPGTHVRGGSWRDPAWAARTANQAGDANYDVDGGVAHALVGVRLTIKP